MPKFAPVAPIQVLEGLWAHSPEMFGDYHLLLAHHTVEHRVRFAELFQKAADAGWMGTVIMDNSIVELGDAVSLEMIADAVNLVHWGDIVVFPVLPDVMGQGEETRSAVRNAYPLWEEAMPGEGFVAVCQGTSLEDFQESLELFGDKDMFPNIEMLSIPRILTKTIGSRIRPAIMARDYLGSHKIHFLGFSDNIRDDVDTVHIIPEAGIDSAVPLRVREMFTEFVQTEKRSPTWFETAQVDKTMCDNLQTARKLFQ